jgi:hypothetical protein
MATTRLLPAAALVLTVSCGTVAPAPTAAPPPPTFVFG